MANKKTISEGPACACGKGDLYEDWIKLQENKKEAVSDSTTANQMNAVNSADADKDDQKQVKSKK